MKIANAETYQKREKKQAREYRPWVFYKYRDSVGNVIFAKVRVPKADGSKTFLYAYQPPGWPFVKVWIYSKPDYADKFLYNLPQLLSAKDASADIWWVEGEKDADRLEEEFEDASAVVCHHGGAGKITPEQAAWFRGHTGFVVLMMDLDEDGPTGANPGAYDVIRRYDLLREVGIAPGQIRVAAPAVGKDVHDHLTAGLSLAEVVPVTDLRPLREKASRGNGFNGWGYGNAPNPETIAALKAWFASGRRWEPKVER